MLRGESHPSSKLTEDQVIQIRQSALPHRVLAAKMGVSKTLVGNIKRGTTWSFLEND